VRWRAGEFASKRSAKKGRGMSKAQQKRGRSIIKQEDPDSLREYCVKYSQLGCDLLLAEMEDEDGFNAVVIHRRNVALIPVLCEFGINVDALRNSFLPTNEMPLGSVRLQQRRSSGSALVPGCRQAPEGLERHGCFRLSAGLQNQASEIWGIYRTVR
jgi:hypothetical protein